jgi:hypothetical protein
MAEPNPTDQQGGANPTEAELHKKGEWARTSQEGIVPPELGGADADDELLAEDPELGGAVTGRTTGSDEPATAKGVDPSGGDNADALTDGGPELPADAEPDLKDIVNAATRTQST